MKRRSCQACRDLAGGPLNGAIQPGKKSIDRKHDPMMQVPVDCSANVEKALARAPGEKTFDYLLVVGDDCETRLVEIHPASSTGAVKDLIEKKQGTEIALRRAKVRLPPATWHWLVPGKGTVAFKPTDVYGKRLEAARIAQPRRAMTV